ncbi:hypothetical protein FS837_011949 [Tulasnella sp. UAMH 9824]|nr:hypothetical protein FS837_011949 [Tulasnella sp. UAMH 9824]
MSSTPLNQSQNKLWTFGRSRLTPPKSRNSISEAVTGDLVAELRFYGTIIPADIPQEQLRTLEPGQWLTSDLCSFYCYEVGNAYLEGAPGRGRDLVVLHSRTWDLAYWVGGSSPKVRAPGAIHALEPKYLVFPGNDTNSHFFLCIVIRPYDLLYDRNPNGPVRTLALILNSMHAVKPQNAKQKIQGILSTLADGHRLRNEKLSEIEVYHPLMPQQPNNYDCGLYPGFFLSVFLEDPDLFTAHCTGQTLIEGPRDVIWQHDRIKFSRRWLKSLVLASAEIRQAALDFSTDIPPPNM